MKEQQQLTKLTKPIGGYIELQLSEKEEYYPSLIKVNTGRSALEYILRIKEYKHIYLPYFTCEVLLEPVMALGLTFDFYHIDSNLDPIIDFEIKPDSCFVYTNYFGLKQRTVSRLSTKMKNLIVDNCGAFFSHPIPRVDTFYSCRKFFGVPDGAYLQINSDDRLELKQDISIDRFSHLIKSIDLGIEAGYQDYVQNNLNMNGTALKGMSALSQKILSTIDYEECRRRRHANFAFLHNFLRNYNELQLEFSENDGPLVYPLLTSKEDIKEKLIERKVFVPTFWPNVLEWTTPSMYENRLTRNLIALPVDHRYNLKDMTKMLNIVYQVL